MKQVCLQCRRKAAMGSLWCQETNCSVSDKPAIFEYGESLADIRIDKLADLLRTSAVYQAIREGEMVQLKVAHNGHQERLKRETHFLLQLQERKIRHPALPTLLPAYAQADLKSYPYGVTVTQDQTLHFAVFEPMVGESMQDILLQDPQPWYQHAGWLVLGLADVLALMHKMECLHLCLSPECVLVRHDRDGVPRPILLDLGMVTTPERIGQSWNRSCVPPAYVAPELIGWNGGRVGASSDVYGLGLIMHEMLAGRPAYQQRLRADNQIFHDVLHTPPLPTNRPDLHEIPEIVARAIDKDSRRRQPDIFMFARELQGVLPTVPKERKERRTSWRSVAIVLAGALAIAVLLALTLALSQALPG